MRATNEALEIVLEFDRVDGAGVLGLVRRSDHPIEVDLAAISAPFTAAVVWGMWVAPRARLRLEDPYRFAVELLVFGAAVAALAAMGRTDLSVILGTVVAANLVLLSAWSDDERRAPVDLEADAPVPRRG